METQKIFALFAFILLTSLFGQSQSISQWRGPNRDGIYPEQNLLKSWSETGPELLWFSEEIGLGYSAPVVSGNRIYINGEINKESFLFAFDLGGKLIWKAPNGPEFFGEGYSANFPGARSAPTVYGDLVYICSGLGRIACLEAESGKEKWSVDMLRDFGGKLNYFGYSESLMIDDTKVYCYPGGEESKVVALNRLTGKIVWTSKGNGDSVSFCSPIIISLPKRNVPGLARNLNTGELVTKTIAYDSINILVTLSREYMLGIDTKNGELLWSFKEDSVKLEGEHSNTPVYSDGSIYSISGDENGNGAYKIELSADGRSVKEVWRNGKIKNALGGFVKIDNRIYTTSDDKKLKVLDVNTGEIVETLSGMKGILIAADNLLFCYTDNGYVNLISGIGTKLEVVGKFKITKGEKEHFAHPVIANGVLYIRHGNALMAYQIK